MDASGRVNEQIQAASTNTDGTLFTILAGYAADSRCGTDPTFGTPPLCGLPQSSSVRWTTIQYTDCCLAASQRVYHTIPSTGTGSAGTNFDQTGYGYDPMKRQNRTVSPGGTITDIVFDARGLVTSTWVGTDDAGGTVTDPSGGGADPANNMVRVSSSVYDNGTDGGDANLTTGTLLVDGTISRVTAFLFDWRNRRTDADGEINLYQQDTYDNLDRVVKTERFNTTPGTANLIGRIETLFDDRGRVYRTITYAVTPGTGAVGNSLISNSWFDDAGNPIKSQPAGSSLFTKTTFDSLGRGAIQYSGYDLDETTYADAFTVIDDVIMEQAETLFDAASHAIVSIVRQRFHNAPDSQTAPLVDPGTAPKARVTYAANWLDGAGRNVATAGYGTNGGSALSRPDAVPVRSDTVLVSSMVFDDAGNMQQSIDPAGKVTFKVYDAADHEVTVIENYVTSSSSSSGGDCPASDDQNRTTQYTYTPDGQQATMTAVNSGTSNQTTTWTFGTTLANSAVATSTLLHSVTYPDSTGGSDVVTYAYNRQGERTRLTDQRGCVHAYDFDLLGRPTHDRVTTLGSGVDGTVRRLSSDYEVRGLPLRLTSYDNATVGTGSVVNQVKFAYNSLAQLITDAQSHLGLVNSDTPKVQLSYADGGTNTIRPLTLRYPNNRVLNYGYGSTAGMNDALSRIGSLIDNDGPATHLADYSFL